MSLVEPDYDPIPVVVGRGPLRRMFTTVVAPRLVERTAARLLPGISSVLVLLSNPKPDQIHVTIDRVLDARTHRLAPFAPPRDTSGVAVILRRVGNRDLENVDVAQRAARHAVTISRPHRALRRGHERERRMSESCPDHRQHEIVDGPRAHRRRFEPAAARPFLEHGDLADRRRADVAVFAVVQPQRHAAFTFTKRATQRAGPELFDEAAFPRIVDERRLTKRSEAAVERAHVRRRTRSRR
jgi:hypothetical protein